ncbi:MAG: metal ABC transporter substrate-binding protein [Planctomycetota bacterium]|jgi:zinc transport system substrate-binding protein
MACLRPAAAFLGVLGLTGCDGAQPQEASGTDGTPTVLTVNYPLQYFAERIGGEAVEVEFPGPPDGDPAFWEPDAETIAAYQQADIVLLNGAGYAHWTEMASLPLSRLVDTSDAFRDQYIVVEDSVTHAHGPQGKHEHRATAFTTWLDPTLAAEQAWAIRDAFSARWPALASGFEQGFENLRLDLEGLDNEIGEVVSGQTDRPLVVSHPVYQYLERRYGLNVVSVHWEPDEVPEEAMWVELEKILQDHPARFMIWEGEPIPESVDRLKTLGVESVVFSPCGNVPGSGDYLSTMRANVAGLELVFSN